MSEPQDHHPHGKKPVKQCLDQVSSGTKLTKLRRTKSYNRGFRLRDGLVVEQTESKKPFPWHRNIYSVDDIREVRPNMNSEVFLKNKTRLHDVTEDRCFSLVIGRKRQTLDLVAGTSDERDAWVRSITSLISKRTNTDIRDYQDAWVKEFFAKADKDHSGSLTVAEIQQVLPKMGISIRKSNFDALFAVANTDRKANRKGEQSLDKDEFVTFCRILQARPELDPIFQKYCEDEQYMSKEEFLEFLIEEQKMNVTESYAVDMIKAYEPSDKAKENERLSIEGFRLYLMDEPQQLMKPEHRGIFQDMTRPLQEYFINSSHNTYLLGDQLKGKSSTEAYIDVLRKGCRCVELDCWDGPDNEPIVYHGYTLTTKILYKDCIKAIYDYAFTASQYPVLLSFENHCSKEQQKVMAEHLKEIAGDTLLKEQCEGCTEVLPSPEALKGKILVKGKRGKKKPKPIDEEEEDITDGIFGDEIWEEGLDTEEEEELDDFERALEEEMLKKKKETEKKQKKEGKAIAKELSEIVVYMAGTKFKGFQDAYENHTFDSICSIKESKFKSLLKDEGDMFVESNKRFLVRLYPDGGRTDSSNYDPTDGWICGSQIVALNFQTVSKGCQLIQGLFSINGNTGYVLKPSFLRDTSIHFDPRGPFPQEWGRRLTITVISGHQLPRNRDSSGVVDPYIKVKICGVMADRKKAQTSTIKNNGFNPVWNETFVFDVNVPELALLRLAVKDKNMRSDSGLAYYCIPFDSMQQGYRHVKLRKPAGRESKRSFLLLHIKIEPTDPCITDSTDL